MITNTELFYVKAKEFQNRRVEINDQYEEELQKIARYKGSEGYNRELKKLTEKRDNALDELKKETRQGLSVVIGAMIDAIGRRTIPAPTADQVNLLSVLRMKKKVTADELERVAKTVKENPMCLDVLNEIAQDHEIMRNFSSFGSEMSSQRALDIVSGMRKWVEDFLEYDTSRAARLAEEHHERLYGNDGHTVSYVDGGYVVQVERKLPKRPLFTDKEGCFLELAGIDGESLKLFSKIVDAGNDQNQKEDFNIEDKFSGLMDSLLDKMDARIDQKISESNPESGDPEDD